MPASPKHYDKFTYAVKRKPESATPSPNGRTASVGNQRSTTGLQPLSLTRDGFAIAEDGSLMSRVVSPPRWTPGTGPVVFASTAPTIASPKKSAKPAPANADPWGTLIGMAAGQLSEDEIALLTWDTVAELIAHFGITNPVDIGKVQITWRKKQAQLLGDASDAATLDAASMVPTDYGDDNVLVMTSPERQALQQQPIMQIAYGRPSSPRRGGRFVPDHKKPLKWNAASKIDTGRTKRAE